MKGYFFLQCVNADAIRFIFHFITLLFGDLVDNIHLEVTMSQNSDLSPSFHFMTKNR